MAQTAEEYRERLLHTLNGDADMAERSANYLTNHELPYAETDEYRDTVQDKIDTYDALKEYCRALVGAIEDVETGF